MPLDIFPFYNCYHHSYPDSFHLVKLKFCTYQKITLLFLLLKSPRKYHYIFYLYDFDPSKYQSGITENLSFSYWHYVLKFHPFCSILQNSLPF